MTAAEAAPPRTELRPGDPVPWFYQRTSGNPRFAFHAAAGRYVVLCFYVSSRSERAGAMLAGIQRHRALFDDVTLSFFGVSLDSRDERDQPMREAMPGIRFFWDGDGEASRACGSLPKDGASNGPRLGRQFTLVLDPTLRVMKRFALADEALYDFLQALPPPERFTGTEVQAPVLVLPQVFEPALCRRLIETYEKEGGIESGFMRDVNGKTVLLHDAGHKRRKDVLLNDEALIAATRVRVLRRIVPEILKVHMFKTTRMERYIVSCYADEDNGHFRAHRDNTTRGTAHRRFAVSINLNDDFDGGDVCFPEYSPRGFKMAPGTALVFSCSLLHAVRPVTRGRRYAFLPFLYDEEAAAIRQANHRFLQPS